ncbi:hypothetical protein [Massilia sp. TN1-12]|uniref:hypothetical protein n=1 Tax=Massilia paldalensis TaxID=3377675 RepID=UPI00384AED0B
MNNASLRGTHAWGQCIAACFLCAAVQVAHAEEAKLDGDVPAVQVGLDDIRGQYAFPGGRLLTMTGSAYRIRARLDGHEEVIVARTGPATFRAEDDSFTLHFRPHGNGNVVAVDLEEAPGPAMAHGAVSSTMQGAVHGTAP